jgi:hypothetical protein
MRRGLRWPTLQTPTMVLSILCQLLVKGKRKQKAGKIVSSTQNADDFQKKPPHVIAQ